MHFIVYIIVYPFLWLISILPFRLLYAFSDFLYLLVFKIFGYRKRVVKSNLNLIFPEKSKEELNRITKAFYHHLCDMLLESIKSITISEAEMKKRYVFKNVEAVHKLEKENKSIVLMMGHYGSWEWIFIIQKHVNHNGYAIYKRIENKYFDRLVRKIRARYNTYLITNKETMSTLRQHKADGIKAIYGFLSDQSPKIESTYHWKEFMNIKVPVHTGAEKLSKELDMGVVFFKTKLNFVWS